MAKKKSALGNTISGESREWQVENDLRVLMEAEEIREDKERMDKVRALAKEKLVDMAKVSAMAGVAKEPGDKD